MLHERLQLALEGLHGVLLIDIDDYFAGLWDRTCVEYQILQAFGKTAEDMGVPVFIDKNRGILEDYEAIGKEDLTRNWVHIPRFNYERAAAVIERTLGIPREQTYLGFAGTYAESCVRTFLWALCEEKIIP